MHIVSRDARRGAGHSVSFRLSIRQRYSVGPEDADAYVSEPGGMSLLRAWLRSHSVVNQHRDSANPLVPLPVPLPIVYERQLVARGWLLAALVFLRCEVCLY